MMMTAPQKAIFTSKPNTIYDVFELIMTEVFSTNIVPNIFW